MNTSSLIQNQALNSASLFEQTLQNRAFQPLPIFQGDHGVQARRFSESPNHRFSVSDHKVKAAFPNLLSGDTVPVLTVKGPLSSVQGKRIAVLFSGGPAAGGHNVVAGIAHALGDQNTLLGVKSGPKGLLNGDLAPLCADDIASVANMGGFDLLGSDRTKIKSEQQFEQVKSVVRDHQLDGIIIIGGDDSNTNAALIAEFLYDEQCSVIGVPKTIDGDLQIPDLLPISFGFDTATRIYSELLGNILQDTPSSQKYWHFVKLMGRSASHVTLEVALQTCPPLVLISEEIAEKQWRLSDVVAHIANGIILRSQQKMNYGVVLIPEGLIEFIPEFQALIANLNVILDTHQDTLSQQEYEDNYRFITAQLPSDLGDLLDSLPANIQRQLVLERDSHGNVQVSQIPTEALLIDMTQDYLKANAPEVPFASNAHFFGYEGRCGAPSSFDAYYTYNLGLVAGSLVLDQKTGYMAAIRHFDQVPEPLAIPLTGLITQEQRGAATHLVIEKALVNLDSPAFQHLVKHRDHWCSQNAFKSPGPRQYWGPTAKQLPLTVALNQGYETYLFNDGS